MNGHIMLSTGKRLNLEDPDPGLLDIDAIAASLSKLCRFNGHVRHFYSVAEHCCLVAHLVGEFDPDLMLAGLLHDASEAFIGDMIAPLKAIQPEYVEIERGIEEALAERYNLPTGSVARKAIKAADLQACAQEVQALMPGAADRANWIELPEPQVPPWTLGWSHFGARKEFLWRYNRLTGGRG